MVQVKKKQLLERLKAFKNFKLDSFENKNSKLLPEKLDNSFESIRKLNQLTKKEFKLLPKISVSNTPLKNEKTSMKNINNLNKLQTNGSNIIALKHGESESSKKDKISDSYLSDTPNNSIKSNKAINVMYHQ